MYIKFSVKLAFVAKLVQETNCYFIFYNDSCLIQDWFSNKTIGASRLHDGLFVLNPEIGTSQHSQVTSSSIQSLWHQHLGHLGHSHLKLFFKFISYLNFPFQLEMCETCPLAKQTHFPFSSSKRNSIALFDLIHYDIWDKFHVTSSCVVHYFLRLQMIIQDPLGLSLCKIKVRLA